MKVTKTFLAIWVRQMLNNQSFVNDRRLKPDTVGLAATGNMESLKSFLEIYRDHAGEPKAPIYFNLAPDAPDNTIRNLLLSLPKSSPVDSINEVIQMIDDGSLELI